MSAKRTTTVLIDAAAAADAAADAETCGNQSNRASVGAVTVFWSPTYLITFVLLGLQRGNPQMP